MDADVVGERIRCGVEGMVGNDELLIGGGGWGTDKELSETGMELGLTCGTGGTDSKWQWEPNEAKPSLFWRIQPGHLMPF